jgi:hypothetical protein
VMMRGILPLAFVYTCPTPVHFIGTAPGV